MAARKTKSGFNKERRKSENIRSCLPAFLIEFSSRLPSSINQHRRSSEHQFAPSPRFQNRRNEPIHIGCYDLKWGAQPPSAVEFDASSNPSLPPMFPVRRVHSLFHFGLATLVAWCVALLCSTHRLGSRAPALTQSSLRRITDGAFSGQFKRNLCHKKTQNAQNEI